MFHGKTLPYGLSEVARAQPVVVPGYNVTHASSRRIIDKSFLPSLQPSTSNVKLPPPNGNGKNKIPEQDLASRFIRTVESMDNDETLRELLLSGYYRVQSLEEHLKNNGIPANAKSFLKSCSYKTYYRFFPPLHPHHSKPYHDQNQAPRDVDCLTTIKVELFALENNVADDVVKAGFKISAEWEPALWELRSWKPRDPSDDNQSLTQIDQVLKANVDYKKLPTSSDKVQEAILNHSFVGRTAFFGPSLIFSTTRSGEQKKFDGHSFSRVIAMSGTKRLGATLHLVESLLTEGDFQQFPFDTRVATFHITSNEPIREIKFAPPSLHDISKLWEQARILSRGNDWKAKSVTVKLLLRDVHSYDWDDPRDMTGLGVSFKPEQDGDRSKILIKIAFKRNWRSWFWKIMFPLDVITCVGFNAFLLLPMDRAGPTSDQRTAITTYLATVLLAQAAFTISLQPMLPRVSYMTILDVHNNFCFLITAVQAVIFAAIPSSAWGSFAIAKARYPGFIVALFLLCLEHLFIFLIFPRLLKRRDTVEPPSVPYRKLSLDPEKAKPEVRPILNWGGRIHQQPRG